MNVLLNSGNIIEFVRHGLLVLNPGTTSQLVAERGTLWVTDTQSQKDRLLEQGERFSPPAGATVYVEALGDGAVRLIEEPADGTASPNSAAQTVRNRVIAFLSARPGLAWQ